MPLAGVHGAAPPGLACGPHPEPPSVLKVGRGAAAPPFLVMDVIAAANARQAALPAGAPHVIRMEVGQPGTGAPALPEAEPEVEIDEDFLRRVREI